MLGKAGAPHKSEFFVTLSLPVTLTSTYNRKGEKRTGRESPRAGNSQGRKNVLICNNLIPPLEIFERKT